MAATEDLNYNDDIGNITADIFIEKETLLYFTQNKVFTSTPSYILTLKYKRIKNDQNIIRYGGKMNGDYKTFWGYIALSIIAWLYSLMICRKNHSVLLLFTAAVISVVLKWNPMWSFIEGGFILVLAIWFNASIRNKKKS